MSDPNKKPPQADPHAAPVVGRAAMTDEMQAQVSERLKRQATDATASADGPKMKVRARALTDAGRFRGGQHIAGGMDEEGRPRWSDLEVTEGQRDLLRADPYIVIDGESQTDAKWPPEGLTPDKAPQLAGAANQPPVDSTGRTRDGMPPQPRDRAASTGRRDDR